MTEKERESICCKCGICCLHRLCDKKTGNSYFTHIACSNLDLEMCLCSVYESRFQIGRDCKKITLENLSKLSWLPETCGYRTVYEKRDFEWWHPLVSGSSDTVHQAGISIKDKMIVSEDALMPGDVLKTMLFSSNKNADIINRITKS